MTPERFAERRQGNPLRAKLMNSNAMGLSPHTTPRSQSFNPIPPAASRRKMQLQHEATVMAVASPRKRPHEVTSMTDRPPSEPPFGGSKKPQPPGGRGESAPRFETTTNTPRHGSVPSLSLPKLPSALPAGGARGRSAGDSGGATAALSVDSAHEDMLKLMTARSSGKKLRTFGDVVAQIRENPTVPVFVYCNHAEGVVTVDNGNVKRYIRDPYRLRVVAYDRVVPENYHTVSATGVVHFLNGFTDHCSLAQFDRESRLFSQLIKYPFFNGYLENKVFYVWKYYSKHKKQQQHLKAVESSLLIAHKDLGPALRRIRALCAQGATLNLFELPLHTTYGVPIAYTLEELVDTVVKQCRADKSLEVCTTVGL